MLGMPTGRALFVTILAVLAFGTPSFAREDDVLHRFEERLDVAVVEVEVVVTDSDGQRVHGLGAADFRLLVDGEELPIDFFTEIREGRAVDSGALEIEPAATEPAAAALGAVGTRYLVFVDDFYAIRTQRNLVLAALREQVGLLRPGDRMAIVAFDGRDLELLAPWTDSREALDRALEQALDRPTAGLLRASNRRLRRLPSLLDSSWYELERELAAVSAAMRGLRPDDGRRVLLLLAGAWPVQGLDRTFAGLPTGAREPFELFDPEDSHNPVIDTANLLGYTVYPVDIAGLRANAGVAEDGEPPSVRRITGLSSELFRQGDLRRMAAGTGGRALVADRRFEALARVADDTRSYYWLSFTPERVQDSAHHRVEIEVSRPGLSVRTRAGYRDLTRETELALLVEGGLLFGDDRDGRVAIVTGEPERLRGRRMKVPFTVEVPWSEVTFLEAPSGWVAKLEIRLGVRDSRGELSEIPVIPLELTYTELPDPGGALHYEGSMTLWREPHRLLSSIHDLAGDRVSNAGAEVVPP